jgi:hypothetical protein
MDLSLTPRAAADRGFPAVWVNRETRGGRVCNSALCVKLGSFRAYSVSLPDIAMLELLNRGF